MKKHIHEVGGKKCWCKVKLKKKPKQKKVSEHELALFLLKMNIGGEELNFYDQARALLKKYKITRK